MERGQLCKYCNKEISSSIYAWNRVYCSNDCRREYTELFEHLLTKEKKKYWIIHRAKILKSVYKLVNIEIEKRKLENKL